jgi:hypothetical protein
LFEKKKEKEGRKEERKEGGRKRKEGRGRNKRREGGRERGREESKLINRTSVSCGEKGFNIHICEIPKRQV